MRKDEPHKSSATRTDTLTPCPLPNPVSEEEEAAREIHAVVREVRVAGERVF